MPILCFDHPEPFAMTLGTMLYPGLDEDDRGKAIAFASEHLRDPVNNAAAAGHSVTYDVLARLYAQGGKSLHDKEQRLAGGLWTGDIFKAYYTLAQSHKKFASLENAIRIVERGVARAKAPGVRSSFLEAKGRFITVAHLWAAWSIREGKLTTRPEVGYDGFADFQAFLTEAEILRHWGQNWRQARAKARPPFPPDVWRVPDDWRALERQPGWPKIGIPKLVFDDDILADLRPVPGA